MQIYADTDELYQRSEEILVISSDIEKTITQIECLVSSLSGNWQGDSERIYESKIIYLKQLYDELSRFLREYSAVLKNCAERYNQCDAELTSKINFV